jgi:hypothetical protein
MIEAKADGIEKYILYYRSSNVRLHRHFLELRYCHNFSLSARSWSRETIMLTENPIRLNNAIINPYTMMRFLGPFLFGAI